jgi:hypothetical protein
MGIFTKIRQHIFRRDELNADEAAATVGENGEIFLDEPQDKLGDEITQSTTMIDLAEQLRMIQIAKTHMQQFVLPGTQPNPIWTSGYALQNEIFVSYGEENVYRCNLEAFFQDQTTGMRKLSYLVSLVRFEGDNWRVFQVKTNKYLEEKRDLNGEE